MIRNSIFIYGRTELGLLHRIYPLLSPEGRHFLCKYSHTARPRPAPTTRFALLVDCRKYSVFSALEIQYWKFHLRVQQRKCYARFLTTSTTKPVELIEYFNETKFKKLFQSATEDLRRGDSLREVQDAVAHLDKMIGYNVFGGKMNRAMIVLGSFNLLASPEQLTDKNQQKAVLLGWCVELLQACFLVADDIMDQSTMRRGKPCWYKLDGVGLSGFNDAFLLYSSIHSILRSNFKEDPCFIYLLELFEKVLQQTLIGQSLDLLTSPSGNTDLARFTQERYDAIVKWKTGFYSFYMPVALALYLVGVYDEPTHTQAEEILLKMGHFFQVQDDYLDCYGDPATIGKVGTDIEENKCSWLIVQALTLASEEQRQVLQTNYGYDDPNKVAIVKNIYNQLELDSVYKKFELKSYKIIRQEIEDMQSDLPKQLFIEYANKIYQRKR